MKIFLPIQLSRTGGTSSFARKFQQEMHKQGHKVVFKPTPDYDILLVSPRAPFGILKHAKQNKHPIIHRLDGVYYPATVAGWKYPFYNLPLRHIRNYYADHIVYQSEYSRHSCDLFLGATNTEHSVIYNGVDTNTFTPNGSTKYQPDTPKQHILITASRFRRNDQIQPLLSSFKEYRKHHHRDSKFVIIGDFAKDLHKPNAENVELIGPVDNAELPSYLRAADAFLFSHQNPPCPNNVIEAMACGLPICGVADGSMPELTVPGKNSELLSVTDEGFTKFRKLNPNVFAKNLHTIMQSRESYTTASRQLALRTLSLSNMTSQYIKVFEQALQSTHAYSR